MGVVSDLDEHKTVEQLKKEILSLRRENKAALTTVNKLLKDLSEKQEKIDHLESMIVQTVPIIAKEEPKTLAPLAPEEEIASYQLERLRTAAKVRSLTLEETRMFDLLVKNKRLSLDESTINISKANYRDVSDVQLLELAAKEVSPPDDSEE